MLYDSRVNDIRAHLRLLRDCLLALQDRRDHLESLKRQLGDEKLQDIARREQISLKQYRVEREALETSLAPLVAEIRTSEDKMGEVKGLLDSITSICTPRRSTVLVDKHFEIISSINTIVTEISDFIHHSGVASEAKEELIVLGDLQSRDNVFIPVDNAVVVRIYMMGNSFYDARILSEEATAGDLLHLLQEPSLSLFIKTGPTSEVLIPVFKDARIMEELRELDCEEDEAGWPRLVAASQQIHHQLASRDA
jgi:hypothetical protein